MVPLRSEGPRPSSLVGRPRARRWASQGRKCSSVGLKGHSFEPRRRFVENRRWRGLGTAPRATFGEKSKSEESMKPRKTP